MNIIKGSSNDTSFTDALAFQSQFGIDGGWWECADWLWLCVSCVSVWANYCFFSHGELIFLHKWATDNAPRFSRSHRTERPRGGDICSSCTSLKMVKGKKQKKKHTHSRTILSSSPGPTGLLLFGSDLAPADTVVPVPRTNSSEFKPRCSELQCVPFSTNTTSAWFSTDCLHSERSCYTSYILGHISLTELKDLHEERFERFICSGSVVILSISVIYASVAFSRRPWRLTHGL